MSTTHKVLMFLGIAGVSLLSSLGILAGIRIWNAPANAKSLRIVDATSSSPKDHRELVAVPRTVMEGTADIATTLLTAQPSQPETKDQKTESNDRPARASHRDKSLWETATSTMSVAVSIPAIGRSGSENVSEKKNDSENSSNEAVTVKPSRAKLSATISTKQRVDRVLVGEIQAATKTALSNSGSRLLAKKTMANLENCRTEDLMEKPNIELVNIDVYRGRLVHYINGMNTPHNRAIRDAESLSKQLQRPVGLIYNPTECENRASLGCVALDLAGAAYDRGWPYLQPTSIHPQTNPTTRKVAYLLCNSDEPVSIVSHSRGCLIVRNALMIADALSSSDVGKRTMWVATGMPLHDEEIYVRPRQFRAICNAGDPISQTIGLQFNPDDFLGQHPAHHDFVDCYVSKIELSDLSY